MGVCFFVFCNIHLENEKILLNNKKTYGIKSIYALHTGILKNEIYFYTGYK